MKIVKRIKLPNCDICGAPACYDAPTHTGQWANLCEQHFETHANTALAEKCGYRFESTVP